MSHPGSSPTPSTYYRAGEVVRCASAACRRAIAVVAPRSVVRARLVPANDQAEPGTLVHQCERQRCKALTEIRSVPLSTGEAAA